MGLGSRSVRGDALGARLEVEYQVSRAIFLRLVGEWDHQDQDVLRDDSRTNLPLVRLDAALRPVLLGERRTDRLRVDALFSFQPVPGTVVFVGYGATRRDLDLRDERGLLRTDDGFFVKLSWLFRL